MSTILATFYNPKQRHQEVAIAVGAVTAASFLLYQAFATKSKDDGDKKPLPRSPLGILETMKMMGGSEVPMKLLEIAKELDSWNFELNLPIPGHPKVVVVADGEDARSIFKDSLTQKPLSIYRELVYMSPARERFHFVMNPADSEWHRRRKGTAPAFSQKHIRRMNKVAVKQTEKWVEEYLVPVVEKNESFDVVDQMLKVILRAFSETALQYDISDEEIEIFLAEWELIAKEFVLKSASNPFRKYLTAFLPERRRATQACVDIYKLFDRVVNSYRNMESPLEGTVLNLIMTNPTFKNDDQIESELFLYMVAGHDTTAVTISWILMELAKNPEELRAVREALSKMDPEDWGRADILKNVVREGMRLHPVAANTVAREICCDMITTKGYFLPKGTLVFLPLYLTFRDNEVFEDAETFKPSRWENPSELMMNTFMPFAAGKQNCIGQALAKAELHSVLARLVVEFDFSVEEEGHPESSLVYRPVGLRLKATRAKP